MFPIPAAGGIAAPVGTRGCSSVVERHVANVNVVSSNLITRLTIAVFPSRERGFLCFYPLPGFAAQLPVKLRSNARGGRS